VLKTSFGDIEIELWSREAPKACKNFVQLCTDGYYDGVLFHRIVKGFIAQGGDPTGTGAGGESIYGHPFKVIILFNLMFIFYFIKIKNKSVFRMKYIHVFGLIDVVWWLWQMLEKMIMDLNFFSH